MSTATAALLELVTQHIAPDDLEAASPVLREALLTWAGIRPVTYEEFVGRQSAARAEWADGRIALLDTVSSLHERTVSFLHTLLHTFVDVRHLGVVRGAPVRVHLAGSVRSPDLLFVGNPHLDRLKPSHTSGAPDLVVEVLDPATAGRDRGTKFFEYERAGAREYWLVDPHREWAEFYAADRLGRYQPCVAGDAGVFRSRAVPGFWLRLEWLWELPQPIQALRELSALAE